jgi:hypothetical protein
MRSVAVAAYKSGDLDAEGRQAIEKYTDKGNVAYFGSSYLDYKLSAVNRDNVDFKLGYDKGYADVSRSEATTPAGEKIPVLGLIANAGNYGWLTLNLRKPAIKDISGYKYMYLWAYAESETNKTDYRMGFNDTSANAVSLAPNAWTQIVFENVDGIRLKGNQEFLKESEPIFFEGFNEEKKIHNLSLRNVRIESNNGETQKITIKNVENVVEDIRFE